MAGAGALSGMSVSSSSEERLRIGTVLFRGVAADWVSTVLLIERGALRGLAVRHFYTSHHRAIFITSMNL